MTPGRSILTLACVLFSLSTSSGADRSTLRKHFVNGESPTIRATVLISQDSPVGPVTHAETATLVEAPFGRMKVTEILDYTPAYTGLMVFEITAVDTGKKLKITSRSLPNDPNYHLVVELGSASIRIDGPLNGERLRQFVLQASDAAFENQVRQVLRLGWMAPELKIARPLLRYFDLVPGDPATFQESGQLAVAPLDCAFDAGFGYPCRADQQVTANGTIGVTRD